MASVGMCEFLLCIVGATDARRFELPPKCGVISGVLTLDTHVAHHDLVIVTPAPWVVCLATAPSHHAVQQSTYDTRSHE